MPGPGSPKTRSEVDDQKIRRMRAAGVVQAVISSGLAPEDWLAHSLYGLRLVNYLAARLGGEKAAVPAIPESLKEKE